MTNSRFASTSRSSFKFEAAAFIRYLALLVFVVSAAFTQVNATINVNSTPATQNDFCTAGGATPSLTLPIIATSNCGAGTIAYQWYTGTSSAPTSAITVAGTPGYAGWNTSTMTVSDASQLSSVTHFWVILNETSGACSDIDTLGPFTYTEVTALPTVTLTTSFEVCEGEDADFTANVTAPSPAGVLTYTWSRQPDGSAPSVVKTTSNVLTTSDDYGYTTVLTNDQDDIFVSVTNACGTTTSSTSTVTVNPRPQVTVASGMSTLSICEGDSVQASYNVSNAQLDPSSGGGNVNWTVTLSGDAALLAQITTTGTGNGTTTQYVGQGLAPGSYSATITQIENTDDNCTRAISTNTINVTIYPRPTVTFSSTPDTICNGSGSGTSFAIQVANAEYNNGGGTIGVSWTVSLTETSRVLVTGCTGGSSGLLGSTYTGSGNGTFTFNIPTTAQVGIYSYKINSITNTSNSCGGSVIGTDSISWRVDPTPNVTVIPSSNAACEGTANQFNINVTNAQFCGMDIASASVDSVWWSLTFTDNTGSNIGASPLVGAGNSGAGGEGPFTTSAALAPGSYTFTPGTITVDSFPTGGCFRTISGNTYTFTVNPEPTAAFNVDTLKLCQGEPSTFNITVGNAVLNTVGQNWSINYVAEGASALSSTPCTAGSTAGIITGSLTGNGNGSTVFNVPGTLDPGYYRYIINSITNTSAGCTGTMTPDTLWILVQTAPVISMNPDVKKVCENDLESFNLSITNTVGCSDIGVATTADWTITVNQDDVQSNIGNVITGLTGTGDQIYAISVDTGLNLAPNDFIFDATVVNTTAGTYCTPAYGTRDTFTLSVDPRPYVQINGTDGNDTINVCQGSASSFSFVVGNALQNGAPVDWEITYSESSGVVNANCNGATVQDLPGASGAYTNSGNGTFVINIPNNLPVGQYTYTVTNIVNTDGPCTGFVDSVTYGPETIIINVKPAPIFTVQPDSSEVCENNVATNDFSLNVQNARYCSTPTTIANADWFITSITDNVDAEAGVQTGDTIFGSGNGSTSSYDANSTPSLGAGSYSWTATQIASTINGDTCVNTISANNVHVLTVNPAVDASHNQATVSVCEGETGNEVYVNITNAELNGNPVNWSYTVTESSGNLTSSCNVDVAENASIVTSSTGSGNGVDTFSIPSNLTPGVYTYTISGVLNTDENCTGTSATSVLTIYVYPRIQVALAPDTTSVCEGETANFTINVTNARYCSALNTASNNAPWELDYTDNTSSNIFPDPLSGSGNSNFTFTANQGGLLAPGAYKFYTNTIEAQIVTPTSANCSVNVSDSFTLIVNPEPTVTFNTATMSLCEGTADSFYYEVANAEVFGQGVVWQVSITEDDGVVSNSCTSPGSSTYSQFGQGDSIHWIQIPASLEPGVYTYELNSILNNTHSCTGTVGPIDQITITVYPMPDVDLSDDTVIVCENTTGSVDITVTNAEYCASVGGSLIDVAWEITHTDATAGTIPSSVWVGSGNMSATTYTVNAAFSLTAGSYTFDIAQIENTTHSCVNTDSFSGTELTVIVNDLPTLTINSVTPNVCDGDAATINYTVSDVEATDGWSFSFNDGTGSHTVTGVGPTTADTTTAGLTPPGIKTITYTAITNTTTTCVGNTPANNNVNVLALPDVTAFAQTVGTDICSDSTNDYNVTVTNSAGKGWTIWYHIGSDMTPLSWSGTGNGTFTRSIPTQWHQDANGVWDARNLAIDSIGWTTGAAPLCKNYSVSDDAAPLNVKPNPYITLVAPDEVCVNYTADIEYTTGGLQNSDVWEFDWYTTNPTDGPNTITSNGNVTDTFTTLALFPVGWATVSVPTISNTTTGCDSSFAGFPWSDSILINPPTVPGTLTQSYTICDGDSGPYGFKLSGYTGDIVNWDSSDNDGFTWYDIGHAGSDTHTVVNPHLTTRYHVVVKSGACPADTSNEVILFVHPQPAAAIVSANDSICEGSNITVVYSVSGVPNTHNYTVAYTVTNGATSTNGTWTGTGSSATITETLTNGGSGFTPGTWTITLNSITNNNTGCDTTLTDNISVLVKSNPVGSTASTANDTLCSNSNGFVRWDGTAANGYVVKWQKKTPAASTWTDISGSAADSIEFIGLTTTTMFRAVIANAPCTGQAFSAPVTVTVVSTNPTASWSLPASLKFCASPSTTTGLTYVISGTNGNNWTLTILEGDSTHTVTGSGDGSGTYTTTPGSMLESFEVTLVKLEITSGSFTCTKNLDNTGIANIKVIDLPSVSLNSLTASVCDGDSVNMSITVSDIKASESWSLSYTIAGNAKTATGTGSGTFNIKIPHTVSGGNATQTVMLNSITNTTTKNSSGSNCVNSLTGVSGTYFAKSATVAGVIGSSISVCKGASGFVTETTASTNGSSIIGWMTRTWNSGTSTWSSWTSTGNTSTSQAYVNIQTNTEYKAVYQNSPCSSAESNVVTITVEELPVATIALASGSDTICEGNTATINVTVTNIDNGQTFTLYYVEGSSNKSQSFTNNGTNSHSFTTGTITSTTDITLTRIETTSGTQCSNTALNSTVTVTVQENPTATIASADSRLCHGETVDFAVTVGNVGSTDAWSLVVSLDGNNETFTGTGVGTFSFTTTGTVTSSSDVLALVSITNNSTQDACNKTLSESRTITVDPTTVAGVIGTAAISSDTIVCLGGSGIVKEFTAGVGNIVKWQSRRNGSSTWVDINSTSSTQFFFNLTDTTEYRAVYESGLCAADFSNVVVATPKALPVVVISTIVDDSICAGETADFEITVTNVDAGSTFQVTYSEGSVNKTSATLTQNASGVHTLTTGALTSNTLVQMTGITVLTTPSASVPACSNTASSNGTVTVLSLPYATITAGPSILCQADDITFTVTVTNVLATDNWALRYELESDEDTIYGTGAGSVTHTDTDPNTAMSAKIQLIEILNLSNVGTCKSVNTDDWDIVINPPTEPGDIVASVDTICKGGNTSISEVTGTPKQGDIVGWEYKAISAGNWTGLTNNNTTLNVLNLQETTDYRAIYKSGVCDTMHSNVVRIQVEELPLATIAGSTAICAGDSTDLTVTISNVGANQDWELDYLAGTLFGQLTGSGPGSHTLRVGNFTTNSDVILRELATVSGTPQCLNDKLTNKAQARVNINQRPYASLNSTVTPVCQNATSSFSFTVSNVKSGDNWTLTYQVDDAHTTSVTTTGSGPGTFTVTTPALVDAKTYNVNFINILNTTTGCDSSLSGTMDIVVDATTTPGSVASDTTVCYASHVGTINHTGGNGSIVRWETSQDNGTSWATIQNTNGAYTYTNLTKTSLFRVVKKNGVCSEAETSPVTVTVNDLPTAVISGSDTICAGNSGNLTVDVTNTYGEDWSVSYLVGTVLDTISVSGPLTSGTINTGSIKTNTDVTLKKVWMTSGTPQCENNNLNNNATATVEVDDEPNATLISLTDSVCTNNPAYGKVTVSDVRTSENWKVYWSINGGAADSVSGTGAGSFNFTTANLTVNPSVVRLTKIVNMTTGCEGFPTDQDNVIVSPETVGGTLAGADTVCKGANSGSLTLGADAVGTILSWEYSTNGGTTWTTINNTASTYSYSNLTMTTDFRVEVKSGACDVKYSSVARITVNELPVAAIAAVGANNICEGSSTYVALNITNVGAGMDWELTYLQGSSVMTLNGNGPGADTIWTGTLSSTTDITLQSIEITSGSPQCVNNNLNNNFTTTIKVIDNPKATITSYPTDICKGETPTVSILVDNVLSSEAWTVIYRVNNGSNISSTGVGSGTFNLANMPQFNTEGANGLRLVSITNTSSNPNCTGMLSDSITINVDSTSLGGSVSGPSIVCKGDNGTVSLSGYRGDITKWQYSTDGINYYDVANTADSLNFTNLTVKTWYRVIVQNGVCAPATSTVFAVDIQELPTVTINNPSIDICSGETADLSLSIGNATASATWSITYTVNGTAGTYTTGTGTSETITFGPYTANTTIEITGITLTNGLGCSNTISETAVITVTANPTATITTVPDSLCEGDVLTFTATVDDVATGTAWELDYEVDGTAGPTKRGTGSGTFTVNTGRTVSPNSVKLMLSEIALDNSLGCNTMLNDSAEVKVSPTTVGGSLSPSTSTICEGGTVTLTLSGETGAIQNWEYSTDNGSTWTVLSNTANSVTITNITVTTKYRVFVKSGTCSGAYSSEATVTVIPTPDATVSSNAKVCPGDAATFTLHVTDVPATNGWSVVYRRNGVVVTTPVTGTGSGDFNFLVAGMAYNGNPTVITVELVSITNTTHGCVNNDLTSSATARVTPNPVADFTAMNVCDGEEVMFNNTSNIAEGTITTYKWYFGDGDSSVNGNPTHTYAAPGTYNVTLMAWSDNGCMGEITKSIMIYDNPVADFTFSNVCKNEVFAATDASTVANGSIVSWFWTFGDGTTSTAQNPTHTYAASGNYDVTLTVTTDNGCTHMVSKEVTVYTLPDANFEANEVCENMPMAFSNQSAIAYGSMTYEWDFAGQGTSTVRNPSFTFTGYGTFSVRLIATSNNGCKDTIFNDVTVYPAPTADFTVADVCIGDISTFNNTSSVPAPNTIDEWFWQFGDNAASTLENPTHMYDAPGTYNVTLRVITDMGCTDEITKTATVVPLPEVGLTANGPTEFCDGDSVELTVNSARTYDWTWEGGSANTQTVTAKVNGWYKVRITSAPLGCANEDSIFITVYELPDANAWIGSDMSNKLDTISKGANIDLHASGGDEYLWSGNPNATFDDNTMADVMALDLRETTDFTVIVTEVHDNNVRCSAEDQLTVVVLDNFDLIVYNTVTPNMDGANDTWLIDNIWAYPNAEVIIFNRYGMEVYRTTGYQNDWAGTHTNGNDLPDGAYYYVIISPDHPDTVYKGVINLVREK